MAASSSSVSGTPASRAIASRWRKPLVEPPLATAPAIAFSSARRSRKRFEVVPFARQLDGERARPGGRRVLLLDVGGGDHAVADDPEAEHVDDDRHRVGGEVAGAVAGAGARLALDRVELRAREPPALVRADRLPHVLDRQPPLAYAGRRASGRRRARPPGGRPAPAPSAPPARSCRSRRGRSARRSRARGPSARSSRRSPRARPATRACPAWPGTGCRRPRSC